MRESCVVIVSYNSGHDLQSCLPSVLAQSIDAEVVVVDNASPEGTADWIQNTFPTVRLIRARGNLGYAEGNNLAFRSTDLPYIAVLNPDTVVNPGWLAALLDAEKRSPAAGIVTASIRLHGTPEIVNACGNDLHLTGIGFCRGLNQPATLFAQEEPVAAASGAAFLIRRAVLEDLGGFDPEFFTYLEDTDLSVRCWLAGYQVLYVPGAVVEHRYVNNQTPDKLYFLERNRVMLLLKNFRFTTLVLMSPVLLLGELQAWVYALLKGPAYLRAKLRSYGWLLRNWSHIVERRREVKRRVPDATVLRLMTSRLAIDQVFGESRLSRAAARAAQIAYEVLFLPARLILLR